MQKPFLTVKSPVYVFKLTGGSISIINIHLEKLQLKSRLTLYEKTTMSTQSCR